MSKLKGTLLNLYCLYLELVEDRFDRLNFHYKLPTPMLWIKPHQCLPEPKYVSGDIL